MNAQAEGESAGARSTYWAAQPDDGVAPITHCCRAAEAKSAAKAADQCCGVTQTETIIKTINAHWQVLVFTVGANSFCFSVIDDFGHTMVWFSVSNH